MPLPFHFDFKNIDYTPVWDYRVRACNYLIQNPEKIAYAKSYYKDHPSQFIIDWGCTSDPRNITKGQPVVVPFLLYPHQEDWVEWAEERLKNRETGLTEKSRAMGISWLSMAYLCTKCIFTYDFSAGVGSRKREYVDQIGSPKALLPKARQFMSLLPTIFRGGWDERKHTKFMKISFPETNSVIEGEAGDSLGRGAKFTLYLIDEAAWLERPEAADAALSQSAECLIYVSTPKGTNNPFFNKRQSGNFPVFTFHWTDDPTKDEMWYEKEKKKIDDPAIVAQELDISYTASVEGIVIPYVWVEAAVDAHEKLGIKVVGERSMGLDVADEGGDMNAVCVRHGILITKIEEWGGGGGDIYKTVEHVFTIAKDSACSLVSFDSDGLGAGVRGDARNINKGLKTEEKVEFVPFRGSGGVVDPEKEMIAGRTNEDFFRNFKAQAMWALRTRFQNTYRAVVEKLSFQPDEIISISSNCKNYRKLMLQISQPTYKTDAVGRIVIDKKPNGAKSPDLADAVMIAFAPKKKKMWSASSGIFRQSI